MKAILPERGFELGSEISLAASLPARLKGLLGKKNLAPGQGLLIRPCKGIHTFFMKFSIDVVFLDKDNRVVALFRDLAPYRLTPVYGKAVSVLELPSGALGPDTAIGEKIVFC